MSTAQSELARRHLDELLERLKPAQHFRRPPKGWVRAIRNALGMTAQQLASRMGLTQATVTALEHGEAAGTTTLATLERAAAAMDCTLVYALVPNRSLDEIVKQQALKVAAKQVGRTAHNMALEDQAVSQDQLQREIKRIAEEIIREQPRSLWHET